jgi:hypothetical protein
MIKPVRVLTVQNRSSEITDELDEHVFFFRGQLVEAGLLPTLFDCVRR